MAFTAGTTIGPYVVRSALGSGGMGDVYLAHDARLGRDIAIKVLPAKYATDADRLRRFEQEARAASALNHPAIVTVHDFGSAETHPYLCMELVKGETLRQIIQEGPMPMRRLLSIAAQIADGLAKAHDAGIVHRDLKPDNVMVTPDGYAKILDFGLAKLVETSHDAETIVSGGTQAGTVLGTAGYMSPEQAMGRPADARSDQFSLGVLLFEMVTGRRAFDRPTTVETLSAIVRDEVPSVQSLEPATPLPVAWLIDRCLQKTPADRYASTRDLARDLANARDHLSEMTAVAAASPRGGRRTRLGARELAGWAAAAALAVTALVINNSRATPSTRADVIRFRLDPPAGARFASAFAGPTFALSPDGKHLVFMAVSNRQSALWIQSFDSLQARPLPGTDQALGPFWSPDGKQIGFFTPSTLKRIAIDGVESRVIADAAGGGGGATWNADGVIVFAAGQDVGLSRVSAEGGPVTQLTRLDVSRNEGAHLSPVFLGDGKHFAFHIIGPENAGVYIASLDSPTPVRLMGKQSMLGYGAGHLFFMLGRTLMAQRIDEAERRLAGEAIRVADDVASGPLSAGFSVSNNGTIAHWPGAFALSQPTWVSRTGEVLGTVGPAAAYEGVALSPDASEVAVDRFDAEPAILRLDMRGAITTVASGHTYQSTPLWSPAGGGLAYTAAIDTPPNLFFKRFDREGPDARLFFDRMMAFPQGFSPDGRQLTYLTATPETGNDLWLLDMSGAPGPDGYPRKPLLASRFDERYSRISPNGRWLAYCSDESGDMNVYVAPLAQPGLKRSVSSGGGRFPVWSRDGRELYYASKGQIVAIPVAEGEPLRLGAPSPLFEAGMTVGVLGFVTPYDVAPDGRFMINRFVERTSPPATVIMNWSPPAP
jgi:Tol biopolymer transport system component